MISGVDITLCLSEIFHYAIECNIHEPKPTKPETSAVSNITHNNKRQKSEYPNLWYLKDKGSYDKDKPVPASL
jgi:hypothetical protein